MKTKFICLKLAVLLVLNVCFFLSTSCKKPESSFILQQFEYAAGDMLKVENQSTNNKETKWEVLSPNNEVIQTSEQRNPSLVLGMMNPDGYYTLKLTSFSNKEKKSSVDEKPFMIKTERTTLTINQTGNGDHDDYLIYIDNQLVGSSNYNGSYQVKVPLGYRIVKLVAENEVYTESILFKTGEWEYLFF